MLATATRMEMMLFVGINLTTVEVGAVVAAGMTLAALNPSG
ncbi:MAG: hypothetical protein ACLPVW_07955 [Terriglobales bacterium]